MLQDFNATFEKIAVFYNTKKIPKLKTLFRGAMTNIMNLTNLLVRKSLLKENLYNYSDDTNSKFFLPEQKAFQPNEKARVLYDRIKALVSSLEYQSNTLQKDVDMIEYKYLENCKRILAFFTFHNYNSANAGVNTIALREITNKVLASNDPILKRVIEDNIKLLSDNFKKIESITNEMLRYKREQYKTAIRFKLFPDLPEVFTSELFQDNPTAYIEKLNKYMSTNNQSVEFNKHWIGDAIKSCYSLNEDHALEKIKKDFLAEMQKTQPAVSLHSPKEKLMTIISYIASMGPILSDILSKITHNLKFLETKKSGFIEELLHMFTKSTTNKNDFFHIEYINPKNKKIETDTVNINDFLLSIRKKIAQFQELANPNSSLADKVKKGSEQALYQYIEKTYFELLLTKERIVGINGELRLKIPRKKRAELKDMIVPIEKYEVTLKKIIDSRRKYVTEHDSPTTKNT